MRFEAELEDHLTRREAERTLWAVTAWGRYAELFAYDDRTHSFFAIAKAE
jgi:NitT/TauT family transport system ATP-binding protein